MSTERCDTERLGEHEVPVLEDLLGRLSAGPAARRVGHVT